VTCPVEATWTTYRTSTTKNFPSLMTKTALPRGSVATRAAVVTPRATGASSAKWRRTAHVEDAQGPRRVEAVGAISVGPKRAGGAGDRKQSQDGKIGVDQEIVHQTTGREAPTQWCP
jgi:DMSO/TMAO reductase YedYZ molybdopterin-dependent catalytic subunit